MTPNRNKKLHDNESLNGFEFDARKDIAGEMIGMHRPCMADIDNDGNESQSYWAHRGLLGSQVGPGELL